MLLDLDQGSMTAWKNGEKLGVMVAEGLSGPLCWAVELVYDGDSAGIANGGGAGGGDSMASGARRHVNQCGAEGALFVECLTCLRCLWRPVVVFYERKCLCLPRGSIDL